MSDMPGKSLQICIRFPHVFHIIKIHHQSQIGKPQLLNDIRRFLQIIYKITVTPGKCLQTDRDIILRKYFCRDRQKLFQLPDRLP